MLKILRLKGGGYGEGESLKFFKLLHGLKVLEVSGS